jgi:hypothetical protein
MIIAELPLFIGVGEKQIVLIVVGKPFGGECMKLRCGRVYCYSHAMLAFLAHLQNLANKVMV